MKGNKTRKKRKRRKKLRAKERNRKKREENARELREYVVKDRHRKLVGLSSRGISVRFEFDWDNPIPLSSTDFREMVAEADRYNAQLLDWEKKGFPTEGGVQ